MTTAKIPFYILSKLILMFYKICLHSVTYISVLLYNLAEIDRFSRTKINLFKNVHCNYCVRNLGNCRPSPKSKQTPLSDFYDSYTYPKRGQLDNLLLMQFCISSMQYLFASRWFLFEVKILGFCSDFITTSVRYPVGKIA